MYIYGIENADLLEGEPGEMTIDMVPVSVARPKSHAGRERLEKFALAVASFALLFAVTLASYPIVPVANASVAPGLNEYCAVTVAGTVCMLSDGTINTLDGGAGETMCTVGDDDVLVCRCKIRAGELRPDCY